jgi:colicin import membrane protein
MALPLAVPLALAGAGAVAQGTSGLMQAQGMYDQQDERRRQQLAARQRAGQLGLEEADRAGLAASYQQQALAGARQAEAGTTQRLAALQSAGQLSGRDLYLAELAADEARQAGRVQAAAAVAQADREAQAQQAAELQRLEQARQAQRAARTQAVLGPLASLLGYGGEVAMGERQRVLRAEQRQAELDRLRALQVEDTRRRLAAMQSLGLTAEQGATIDRLLE